MSAAKTKGLVVARSQTLLGAAGVFLGDPIQLAPDAPTPTAMFDAFSLISGYVNSREAGTLDIYQGSRAEVQGITPAAPAAGASDGILRLNTFAHPGGAASVGTPVSVQRVGPWVRVRYTNGGAPQTTFRLHVEALE